ncbi:hypothetical protein K474DRAFT_1775210 [Panus rudis PR-1116 ss-1]|nr:hypothetical protein K474DRAFT_1775210 [Panus rudis PR-1116 ss-1]
MPQRIYVKANGGDTPGQLERDHVLSTFRALRGVLPSDPIRLPDGTIAFDSINDMWFPTLKPHSTFKYSTIKFIRPPLHWDDSPHPDWVITELCEGDIDPILQRSLVPRSRERVLARIPYSVCLRTSDTFAPVAWNILTSDGSTRKLEQMYHTADEGKKKLIPRARWESLSQKPKFPFQGFQGKSWALEAKGPS